MERGLGTTHIALSLANFVCSKLGMKTAYIELNTTNQIHVLSRNERKSSFTYKGIVFYPNTTVTSLSEILHKNYRYFIIDMGVLNTYTTTEFLRCDKQFLICSQSQWRYPQIKEKIEKLLKSNHNMNCLQLIMNLSEKESTFHFFPESCACIFMPYIPNPFQLEPKHFRVFSLLLRNL